MLENLRDPSYFTLGIKTVLRDITESCDAELGLVISPVKEETAAVVLELNGP